MRAGAARTAAAAQASALIAQVEDLGLEMRYKACYARICDSKRRFLEAATRYYELSQVTSIQCAPARLGARGPCPVRDTRLARPRAAPGARAGSAPVRPSSDRPSETAVSQPQAAHIATAGAISTW